MKNFSIIVVVLLSLIAALNIQAYSPSSNPAVYDNPESLKPTVPIGINPPTGGFLGTDSVITSINNIDPRVWWDHNKDHKLGKANMRVLLGMRTNSADSVSFTVWTRYKMSLTDSIYAWSTYALLVDSVKVEDSLYIDTVSSALKVLWTLSDTIQFKLKVRATDLQPNDTFADTLELAVAADKDSLLALYAFWYDTASIGDGLLIDTFIITSDTITDVVDTTFAFFRLIYGE